MVLCSLQFLTSRPSLGHRVGLDGCPGPVVKLWGSRQRAAWPPLCPPPGREGATEVGCMCNHGGQVSWVWTVPLKQSTASILCRLREASPRGPAAGGVAFPFSAWHIFWERGTQTLGVGGQDLTRVTV